MNSGNCTKRRITMRLKKPNPLFEMWLAQWKREAKEKGSKLEYSFTKALHSLRKYPLPLKSGKECKILIGFGDQLCKMLDVRLKEYKSNESNSDIVSQQKSDMNSAEITVREANKGTQASALSVIPEKMQAVEDIRTTNISELTLLRTQSQTSSVQEIETFIMSPNTFEIILYVDTHETGGNSIDDPLLIELEKLSVVYEVKHLKVGDYTWICRDKETQKELVLPYIVERKRLDDLASSIKDGRYYEQKYRLKKSGIQNIYYLIENYGIKHVGLPISTLRQAAINTIIQDGFYLKTTLNINHTARFLSNVSKVLQRDFKSKTLSSCNRTDLKEVSINDDVVNLMTFEEFNKSSSKNKSIQVTDLFVKMLVQINGMSVDKAVAVTKLYPTPILLLQAYQQNSDAKGDALLANVQFGKYKKIGPLLSRTVYQLFTLKSFNR